FEWIPAKGEKEGKQVDCGVKIQGASSRKVSKKHGFRLSFKSQFGAKKLKGRFFPDSSVKSFDGLILRNPTHDSWAVANPQWRNNGRYVNDMWAAQTQRLMGHLSPHHRWVHLFLNGLYWGVYDLCERPDEHFAAAHLGGDPSQYDVFNAGRLRNGTEDHFKRALKLTQAPEVATRKGYEEIEDLVNIEALIDYFLYNVYSGNIDWLEKNHWFIGRRNSTPKFRFINWDAEIGFFEKWEHQRNPQNLSALNFNPLIEHNAFMMATHGVGYFYLRLKRNLEFRLHLADRLHFHTQQGGLLSPQSTANRYRALLDEIEPLLSLESSRWGNLYTDEPYGPQTEHWEKLTTQTSWLFQEFFPHRSARLNEHFKQTGLIPTLSPPIISDVSSKQAILSNSASEGKIYYTSDDSDPRERWTGKPTGFLYKQPIRIHPQAVIKARTFHKGEWSALSETKFSAEKSDKN
ncbi:CotH kinase family protein, partial [Akkermansiaceae bacterium]|nr:CotH kinase family protein [Akkermansiaceae bacterium]